MRIITPSSKSTYFCNRSIDENRPEQNNLARPLVQELRRALDYQNEDMIATLERQAAALDSAFRRLLSNADITYENNETCEAAYAQYAAAFRAQELFCRTARALKLLKQQDKKPKSAKNKKRRRVKRTEGSQ